MTSRKSKSTELGKEVSKKLLKYDKLNFMEHFAMYLGSAQLLELGLKNVLNQSFGVSLESSTRWTLGKIVKELRVRSVREDLCLLLDQVVADRNYIAHELLANEILVRSVLNGKQSRHELRVLQRATYELEQGIAFCELCEKHDAWKL